MRGEARHLAFYSFKMSALMIQYARDSGDYSTKSFSDYTIVCIRSVWAPCTERGNASSLDLHPNKWSLSF